MDDPTFLVESGGYAHFLKSLALSTYVTRAHVIYSIARALKLVSRVGVVVVVAVAAVGIQLLKPAYGFVDILLILAVGMILGAAYIEVQRRVSDYLDKQSKPLSAARNSISAHA